MEQSQKCSPASILVVLGLFSLFGLIVWQWNSRLVPTETFTALSGFNPLTTYDDYGTFGGILHTNDLPYYDKEFKAMICGDSDYVADTPTTKPRLGGVWQTDKANHPDSFIDYQGYKVRRSLLASNYASDDNMSPAAFDVIRKPWLIKKDRPRASSAAPEAWNYHFDNPVIPPYKPLF